jgi:hypothetical protein
MMEEPPGTSSSDCLTGWPGPGKMFVQITEEAWMASGSGVLAA